MDVSVLIQTLLVGVAGALGAAARYLLGRFVVARTRSRIPLATLIINVSGAFLIAILFALATHKLLSSTWQVILATGFLGGYTTFSTMSWEGVQLMRGKNARLSLLYLSATFTLGLGAAVLGLTLGRMF